MRGMRAERVGECETDGSQDHQSRRDFLGKALLAAAAPGSSRYPASTDAAAPGHFDTPARHPQARAAPTCHAPKAPSLPPPTAPAPNPGLSPVPTPPIYEGIPLTKRCHRHEGAGMTKTNAQRRLLVEEIRAYWLELKQKSADESGQPPGAWPGAMPGEAERPDSTPQPQPPAVSATPPPE